MPEEPLRAASGARFAHECALRWSDLDVYGHVNNSRILTLYEEARVALFFIGARGRGLTSFEDGIVIARHEVDYLRPIDYATGPDGSPRPPLVRVELWVEEVRPSRLVVAYELRLAALDPAPMQQHFAPATHEDLERFYGHLEQTLLDVGFLDPSTPKRLMQRMRRLFARARVEREELNILRGILAAAQEAARKGRKVD